MESDSEEIHLQKIDELVLDEGRIVTNAILCHALDIGLKEAEQLLAKYVSDQKANPDKLSVTYLLSGKKKDGNYSLQLAESNTLKEKKKSFEKITNEIVYSIQKLNTVDFNLIALAEKECMGSLRGIVTSEKSVERVLKKRNIPVSFPQKNVDKQKSLSFELFKNDPKNEIREHKSDPVEKASSESKHGVQTETKKKAGGLSNFLAQTPKEKLAEEVQIKAEKREHVKEEKCEEDERVAKKIKTEERAKLESQEKKTKKKTTKTEPGKKKNNSNDGKKRKRIIQESDSEDDIFGKDEEEDSTVVIESDDSSPPVVQQKVQSVSISKNKRRKAVEKTYEDDEGYIVTKTEYVLVSASEEEEENNAPIVLKEDKSKIEAPKKKSPPEKSSTKGKKGKPLASNQTTLMSFFKKK